MNDVLVFPDVRSALLDLLNGSIHFDPKTRADVTVTAKYHLGADEYGALLGPFPLAQIYFAQPGTQGYVDRVDRIAIDVYAPGEQAVNALESIRAFISGTDIETPSGYLDSIESDSMPVEVPYQSDTLNQATATFFVTTRPL